MVAPCPRSGSASGGRACTSSLTSRAACPAGTAPGGGPAYSGAWRRLLHPWRRNTWISAEVHLVPRRQRVASCISHTRRCRCELPPCDPVSHGWCPLRRRGLPRSHSAPRRRRSRSRTDGSPATELLALHVGSGGKAARPSRMATPDGGAASLARMATPAVARLTARQRRPSAAA
jgi:hypothetical protein